MARTPLLSRHQPGGAFMITDPGYTPGDVYFVHSGTGTDGAGYGRNPDAPTATLDYAVGLCTASKGDVIYVMPGHAENLTAATSVNLDVIGVTVIGLGRGNLIPTFSTTAAAGSITVATTNITLKNIKMLANFATGTTAGITIAAAGDGCILDGIVFRDTSAANEFLIHVSVATTVTDLVIRNCSMVTAAGSLTNSILFAGTSTDCVIEDNFIHVTSSDDVIDHLAGASVNLVVRRNVVINADTAVAGYCLRYKSDGTGVAHDNRFAYNKVDAEISTGGAAWWLRNFASNTIAESDLLDPTTAHAIP